MRSGVVSGMRWVEEGRGSTVGELEQAITDTGFGEDETLEALSTLMDLSGGWTNRNLRTRLELTGEALTMQDIARAAQLDLPATIDGCSICLGADHTTARGGRVCLTNCTVCRVVSDVRPGLQEPPRR